MKNSKVLTGLSVLALCTALATPTLATNSPNGNLYNDNQVYSVNGYTDYAEMVKRLLQIEANSQGRVALEVVGQSNQRRDIYQARVGTGEKVVLIESEIHGNENTGTEALLSMLQYLGSSNSPEAQKIREEITLVTLPKMNPDASELDRRGNDMSWEEVVDDFPQLADAAGPAWNYYNNRIIQDRDYNGRPGFDVNRDFNPNLDYVPQAEDFPGTSSKPGWYITPESQTVRDVYKSLLAEFGKVDVFVDLHHQGHYYVEGTDNLVTMSLSADFVPDPNTAEGAKYAEYKDNYNFEFSKQLNLAAYNALQALGENSPFNNITLYQQNLDLPGTALGSFALNGSGTVLFEVRGQSHTLGQKKKGQLVKAVETGLYGIINGVVDGSVEELDAAEYDKIPRTAYSPSL
ncbi:M14 family zinc carboxypeptidase [Mesobacillus subterraneus]|uniref:M14 family zinc carboxypeptidase n=1 Tax=Mesobacillus subterraneus TaxID=285983 RepID=UPI001CFD25C3|nr:M14 family zinc carboxypeptidase [Mesobacillus subterraneus]WLR55431.1 M14 family zinc carboxypeptidase [Mesobacillus subterraneus]